MRVVRRASLIFSLTLIVAIAVGYVARRSEMANERDAGLTAAAQLGAAEMSAIVDAVRVAAETGTDPESTATGLSAVYPELGVCVVSANRGSSTTCAGDGPQLSSPDVAEIAERATAQGATIESAESLLSVAVVGPSLSVVASAPINIVSGRAAVTVWVATFLPDGATSEQFVVQDGIRQTTAEVSSAPSVWVVATTADAITLPGNEQRFYLVIFALAVALLVLAGITLVIEQRSLVERASFDQLTKLPNRGEFERRAADALATAERQEGGLCLLLFDLNGFKLVNDTYGHYAGDEMLKVVGSRLRKAVREGDIVARWGGDEFVVVMPGIVDDEMGAKRAQQLADQIAGRTRLEGVPEPLRVKVSVGVAIWPRHGADLDELVLQADQAMYNAKREGETWRIADPPAAAPSIAQAVMHPVSTR